MPTMPPGADDARPAQLFVGIDVAARSVTISWRHADPTAPAPPTPSTFPQSPSGFTKLQRRLAATGVSAQATLIVLEATGTYWMKLATALHQAGFQVHVVNPQQAHYFAKALLKGAKTDALDAQTLARLAASGQTRRWTPPPPIHDELEQRLAQRQSLLDQRQALRNQLHALDQRPYVVSSVRDRLERLIAALSAEIAALEAELPAVAEQDTEWAEAIQRMARIPGIGRLTALWIVVATRKGALCPTAEAAVALAGLAPQAHQSGTSVRSRATIGHRGDRRLRTALYLATLSAARYNPAIQAGYAQLRARGKPEKVARCAAARKLLVVAWTVMTRGVEWDPDHHRATKPTASRAA